MDPKKLILAIDVGTTNAKICLYEADKCTLEHSQQEKVYF
jgi:glycerol kinase